MAATTVSNAAITAQSIFGAYRDRFDSLSTEYWLDLVTEKTNTTNVNTIVSSMLGAFASLAEWTSARTTSQLAKYAKTMEVVPYNSHFTVPRNAMNGDVTGLFTAKAAKLADGARQKLQSLLVASLVANPNCITGEALYSTSHQYGSNGAQKNDVGKADITALGVTDPTAPSVQEASDVLVNVAAYMQGFKNENDEVSTADARKFVVITNTVPIFTAFQNASILATILDDSTGVSVSNPAFALQSKGYSFTIIYAPAFTGTNKIAFLRADDFNKAYVLGEDPELPEYLDEKSEFAQINDHVLFGIKKNAVIGPGRWESNLRATLQQLS